MPAGTPTPIAGHALSLADLEQMALTCNPSIARAAGEVQAARGAWLQAGLPPNPSVGYQGQQLGSGGLAEQHGIWFEQEFVRGGKLRLSREVASQEVARAESRLAAQQQRVVTDVRIAFYQVLVAQRQAEVAIELVNIARQSLDAAESLERGQEVGRVDVVQSELERENAEILAQNARNRLTAAWTALAAVVGQPNLPPQPVTGHLELESPHLDWSTSLDRLLSNSPEIGAAIANLERARWAVERANVEAVPNLTLNGMVNAIDNGIGGRPDGEVSIGVPLPLWNRNQGGIVQAQGEVAVAQRALEQLELSLQQRLAPVYERYANAHNQVERYRNRILPAARESLDLTRRLYEAGEVNYINLLTTQRTFSQTNLNYLDALRELHTSRAEIEGLLLTGSLDSQ